MQEMIEAKVIHLIIKEPRNEAKAVIPIFHASVFLELLESAIHRDFRESSRVLCMRMRCMRVIHTHMHVRTFSLSVSILALFRSPHLLLL